MLEVDKELSMPMGLISEIDPFRHDGSLLFFSPTEGKIFVDEGCSACLLNIVA